MSVRPGARLGPYEVVSRIGAGGMGEVWRAVDTRLDRSVAIKILPSQFATDAQLKLRFEREAKTVSQLNHPHICVLHDVGDSLVPRDVSAALGENGRDDVLVPYLVMELLEGETLADRIARGPMPLQEVVRYGSQIAEALDRAHRAGITHRDLKPGNIMITKDGAKLLDFGLAKSRRHPLSTITSAHTAALDPLTEEGTIYGTLHYMSPEQLEGEEADARSDIFALGSVLYEMITGKRAFEGVTRTSIISAIVREEPAAIADLQPMTPPALEHVVLRCLEKDRESRWQSAHDIAAELRWISTIGSRSGFTTTRGLRRRSMERFAWTAALLSLLIAAGVLAYSFRDSFERHDESILRFALPLAAGQKVATSYGVVAVSPDGRAIVYVGTDGRDNRLFLRHVNEATARALPGTEGAVQPFFSPDGKWVAFFARHKLLKIPLSGGTPTVLCDATNPRGGSWGDDGTIVFSPFYYAGMSKVAAGGGKPEKITKLANGERHHRWPHLLPGSKAFLFTIGHGAAFDDAEIAAMRLDSGEQKIVLRGGSDARYLESGHLLYRRGGSLYVIPFNARKLEVTGQPLKVADGIKHGGAGAAEYALSKSGLLVFVPANVSSGEEAVMLLRHPASRQPAKRMNFSAWWPRFSPDGERVAGLREAELWTLDLERGISTRLTSNVRALYPAWAADGKRIAFAFEENGPWNVFWRAADGSDEATPLVRSELATVPMQWSPDGTELFMTQSHPETGEDILIFRLDDRSVRPFLKSTFNETFPVFSPDGKWVAYTSDESGRNEVYIRPYQGSARWQISTEGGTSPRWKKMGEVIYLEGERLMRATVTPGESFKVAPPEPWMELTSRDFDVAADGETVVTMHQSTKQSTPLELQVVVNWLDEVKRMLRAAK